MKLWSSYSLDYRCCHLCFGKIDKWNVTRSWAFLAVLDPIKGNLSKVITNHNVRTIRLSYIYELVPSWLRMSRAICSEGQRSVHNTDYQSNFISIWILPSSENNINCFLPFHMDISLRQLEETIFRVENHLHG